MEEFQSNCIEICSLSKVESIFHLDLILEDWRCVCGGGVWWVFFSFFSPQSSVHAFAVSNLA